MRERSNATQYSSLANNSSLVVDVDSAYWTALCWKEFLIFLYTSLTLMEELQKCCELGFSYVSGHSVCSIRNNKLPLQTTLAVISDKANGSFIYHPSLSQSMLSCYLTVDQTQAVTAWGTDKQQNRLEVACILRHLLCFAVFLLHWFPPFMN